MTDAGESQRPPAPPWVGFSRTRSRRGRRIGAIVAGGCGGVLAIAAWLTPVPAGMGTHQQLGWPACGFRMVTGLPCPTCGMTTAFAWMAHGHPLKAIAAQPLGALLCTGVAAGLVIGLISLFTGRVFEVDWYRFSPVWLAFGVGAAVFGAWAVKLAMELSAGGPRPPG